MQVPTPLVLGQEAQELLYKSVMRQEPVRTICAYRGGRSMFSAHQEPTDWLVKTTRSSVSYTHSIETAIVIKSIPFACPKDHLLAVMVRSHVGQAVSA